NTDAIGVCTGTTLSSLWNIAEYDREVIKDGPLFTDAGVFAGTVANAASSRVSILFNIQGFNATISTGYTSSIEAIRYAANFIQSGRVKVVLAGGVESISPASFTGFYRLGFLAGLKGEELSCPFDKRRNGIIIGEGAGVIVLEDETYAKERKAHIYAEVKGAASSFDAYKLGKYQPQGKGLLQSIRKTLGHSRMRPEQIDCVQASANSVKEHDRIETEVLRGIFAKQADKIPVTAVKSMLGESFSAAGLFQVISALGSIKEGFVPAVANYKEKDPDCDLHYVTNTLRSRKVSNVLISSFGPGGNNCALLLSKYQ
ncbi:MAG: beta-ketoacyl synthase N-terminal-like domain-containing protein, partial [Candidatus Omnitrophota bacterium]